MKIGQFSIGERITLPIPPDWPSYPEDIIDSGLSLKIVHVDREKGIVTVEATDE